MHSRNLTKINKITAYLLMLLIVLCLGLTVVLSIYGKQEGTSFSIGSLRGDTFSLDDWMFDGKHVELPYAVPDKGAGDSIKLSTVLPEDLPEDSSIMYYSYYYISRVYVGGVFVGSYGDLGDNKINSRPQNIRIITKLPNDSAGKILTIEFLPIYDKDVILPKVFCGDETLLKLFVVTNNFVELFFCVIFVITAVVLAFTALARYRRFKDVIRVRLFLNFAMFVFLVALWLYSNSDIPQFFSDNSVLTAMLRHVILVCIGIPYLNICKVFLHRGQEHMSVMQLVNILVAFFIVITYIAGIAPLQETIILTHVMDLIIGVSTMIFALLEWKQYKESRMLLHGMGLFVVFVVLGMRLYYLYPTERYSSVMSGLGLSLFITSLFLLVLKQESRFYEEHMAMDIYKDMAYTDKLTECGNRAALERLMDDFSDGAKVVFIMADVNRLKRVNDNYGHEEGDKLILGAANCLKNAVIASGLTNNAEVFRLGGDEFAIIIWNKAYVVGSYYEALNSEIEKYNASAEHKVSIAKGYAEIVWDRASSGFADLYRIADATMYADKELAHRAEQIN